MLVLRAERDEELGFLVERLDDGWLSIPESVGLAGLAVDFDGGGTDFVDAVDVGLLFDDADLLVPEITLLVPLVGALVGLLGFGMVLLEMVDVGLLGPGIVYAEPELGDDAEELDAYGASSEMVFSTLSSFTGTSITAWTRRIKYCFDLSPGGLRFTEIGVGSCCIEVGLGALDDDVDMDSSGSSEV